MCVSLCIEARGQFLGTTEGSGGGTQVIGITWQVLLLTEQSRWPSASASIRDLPSILS